MNRQLDGNHVQLVSAPLALGMIAHDGLAPQRGSMASFYPFPACQMSSRALSSKELTGPVTVAASFAREITIRLG